MSINQNFSDLAPAFILDFSNSKTLDPRVGFARTSTGTYINKEGIIKTAVANEPRFDHNPLTGESLGLLIEEQRTNRITYSENFTNWVKSNITEQYEVLDGPVGITTYSKFTLTQFTNSNGFLRGAAIGAVSDNQIFSGSIYLKKGTCRYAIVFIIPKSTNWQGSYFDLETGVMYKNDGSLSFSSTDVGNGWFRYHITVDMVTGGAVTMTMGVLPLSVQFPTEGPSNNIQPLFTSGEESLYAWGGQMELGSFPTSYIPTTSSSVTRAADVATISNTRVGVTSFTSGTLLSVQKENSSTVSSASTITLNSQSSSTNTISNLLYYPTGISSSIIKSSRSYTSIVRDGLVLNLDAANTKSYPGSGTTWTDLSGNGNTGTLVNGVGFDSANGGSLVFDGSNDYVSNTMSNPGSVPIVFDFWINSNTSTPVGIFDTAPSQAQVLRNYNVGQVEWWPDSPEVNLNITASTWTNITIQYSFSPNRTITYYRNGNLISTTTASSTTGFAWTSLVFGNINGGSAGWYSGKISTIKIYNRALTAAEVSQNFNALRNRFGI